MDGVEEQAVLTNTLLTHCICFVASSHVPSAQEQIQCNGQCYNFRPSA